MVKQTRRIATPAVRRKSLPIESLDMLDKYDPDKESDQFHAVLEKVMASTSVIMTDPRMNPRDLPVANNYLEWLTGTKFLNFQPYSRQVDIGLQLNLDVCWRCTPEYYHGPDVDFKWSYFEYKKRYQLMNRGVCPVCKATRVLGVRKGIIVDKYLHSGCAGMRSSKCLTGNTLVSTPDGPIEIQDFHLKNKVRLSDCDAYAMGCKQKRSYVYRIETNTFHTIEANAWHRMFTAEDGYIQVARSKSLAVGMHFEIPFLIPMCKTRARHDIRDRQDGNLEALSCLARINNSNNQPLRQANSCREVWKRSYAFKDAFFTTLARMFMRFSVNNIGFESPSEALVKSLYAWLEASGIKCRYSMPNCFKVNLHDFIKRGPDILSSAQKRHFWKVYTPESTVYPVACSEPIADLLQKLMSNLDRFYWDQNSPQQVRMTELYAIWASCRRGSAFTTSSIKHLLDLLRPWRDIRWNTVERKAYVRIHTTLRQLLKTRYAKVTKITRSKTKVDVYDLSVPGQEWFVANGLHSHNSVLTGHLIGNTIHRLIGTGDPAAYYSLLPGTVLTCILTATTMQNAERNLYTPMRNMFTMMPWFVNFGKWCKEREAELGVELFKVRETFTFFRYGGLDIRVLSPDRRRIRGSTSFAGAVDELGHFDADSDKVRAGGLEVYSAVSTSLTNVLGAATTLRELGENDVIFPCSHAVSSPFDLNDPITVLRKQHERNENAVTYNIPTWSFNPNLTFAMCRAIALPATFMRDYGCEVKATTGSFFDRAEVLIDLCDVHRNAVKTFTETFTSRSGATFTVGRLKFRGSASEGMVTGLCLDASLNQNSYAFTIFHIEKEDYGEGDDQEQDESDEAVNDNPVEDMDSDADEREETDSEDMDDDDEETLDFYRVVVDAIGEIQPSKDNPIHFTQNVRHILEPLIEKFNVKVVLSDRWQTLQTQQDLMDNYDIFAMPITPKKNDFLTFRQSIYDQSFTLPKCEMEIEDVLSLQGPEDFAEAPVAHLIRQCLTVKELPKTVEKGAVFSDDLFRVCVLAHMACMNPEIRDMLVTEEEIKSDGIASLVVKAADSPKERVNMSAIVFSNGSALVVADPDENGKHNEDEDSAATSFVTRR
jgi:hypothetical protein